MSVLDSLKQILGVKSVKIADLNRVATQVSDISDRSSSNILGGSDLLPIKDIEVTEEYETIKKLIEADNPVTFVTGNAGTGKSTLIQYLRHSLDKQIAVVAPTGVAALNVGGATIHSFFQLPPKLIEPKDIKSIFDRKLYNKLEMLVIDEISMVRVDLLDGVDAFLKKNRSDQRPFGGVQLLLIGDLFQLPPVVNNNERGILKSKGYLSVFFFSSFALQESSLILVELKKIFRQKDAAFIDYLNNIRLAENFHHDLEIINKRYLQSLDNKKEITLTSTNKSADKKNSIELNKLTGQAFTYLGKAEGRFSEKDTRLPSPYNLVLKQGAQVMFTKNDEEKRWVNGSLGIVKKLESDIIFVELLDQSGFEYDVKKAIWLDYKYEYDPDKDRIVTKEVGKYTQYPLMLAWAITIHKSQGKTLSNVFVDLGHGAFASGQVYVALSRVRALDEIRLARPIKQNEIKCDLQIKRFYESLSQHQ